MKKYIALVFLTLLAACGQDGRDGQDGANGSAGARGPQGQPGMPGFGYPGQPGDSVSFGEITIENIDRTNNTPWSDFHFVELDFDGRVEVPESFILEALLSTSGGPGWVDVIVDGHVFCYQRNQNKKSFSLVYKKHELAVQGCDCNNEKETNVWTRKVEVEPGAIVQLIPREPKMAGIVFNFTLPVEIID